MAVKYTLYPTRDVTAHELADLYGVPIYECAINQDPERLLSAPGTIDLHPRPDGDYTLPTPQETDHD